MNLDDFKIQIIKKLEGSQSFDMAVAEITSFQKSKTLSITEKIKKSLMTEIIFGGIFLILFLALTFLSSYQSIRLYFGVFTIVILMFQILLILLYKRTIKLTTSSLPIIQNLKSLHKTLSEFVKLYFQFTMFLIPICLIFSGYLGYVDEKNNIDSFKFIPFDVIFKNHLFLLSFILIFFILIMYFFTKWYLKKLYGNHLKNLKKMIDQLES